VRALPNVVSRQTKAATRCSQQWATSPNSERPRLNASLLPSHVWKCRANRPFLALSSPPPFPVAMGPLRPLVLRFVRSGWQVTPSAEAPQKVDEPVVQDFDVILGLNFSPPRLTHRRPAFWVLDQLPQACR
jgi:hypothetical protein